MSDPNPCNCCEGVKPLTPASAENPPGQSAVAYRAGTHARFKATMQAAIANQPELNDLMTRDDDPSSAVVDAWATTLDVLTFYQERIINEGFLRTAIERRSILELARSIGYELRPGVAASTYLAFELETAPGAPDKAKLEVGTKVQSLPGQNELPQIFETIEMIEARPEWNKFKAKTIQELLPVFGSHQVYLKGVTTQLKPGDGMLIVGKERLDDPTSERWDFRRIAKVTLDSIANSTLIEWVDGLGWVRSYGEVLPAAHDLHIYVFRQRAALFGFNAPDWRAMGKEARLRYLGQPPTDSDTNLDPEWPGFAIAPSTNGLSSTTTGIGLYGEYFDNQDLTNLVGTRLDATIDFPWTTGQKPIPGVGPENFSVRWTGQVQPKYTQTYTFYTQSDDGVRLWVDGKLIINNWADHASKEDSGTIALQAGKKYDLKLEYYQHKGGELIQLKWFSSNQSKEIIPQSCLYPAQTIFLDNLYASILVNSWIVVSTAEYQELYQVLSAAEAARKSYALTAKTTRLELSGENLYEKFNNKLREAVVFAQSEELFITEAPDRSPILQGSNNVTVDSPVEGLGKGRTLIISGLEASSGLPIAEKVPFERFDQNGTQLVFQSNLTHTYKRASVVIYANVAAATHGETKTEVLGSGDASRPFQKFVLKQSPLTYVASDQSPSGGLSTLAVRVNDVLWEGTPSLYGLNRRDHKYITRLDDNGKVTLEFGDGQSGTRLPSGAGNVQASYRVGTGLAGLVKANQISLLMTRPLGVKSVINPTAPEGAQDPETRDQARQNAPLTVLTLDRVVSLQDFEDFARAFSGIGNAQAILLWDGKRRIVHITVAGANGTAVPDSSTLMTNLRNAIAAACDPTQHYQIVSYKPLTFNLIAKVKIDEAYMPDNVTAKIMKLVTDAFSFVQRGFGQAVTASEIIALIQGVEGVVYVDIHSLQCVEKPNMTPRLIAQPAHWDNNAIQPAEILTLSQSSGSLQVIVI